MKHKLAEHNQFLPVLVAAEKPSLEYGTYPVEVGARHMASIYFKKFVGAQAQQSPVNLHTSYVADSKSTKTMSEVVLLVTAACEMAGSATPDGRVIAVADLRKLRRVCIKEIAP